MVKPGGAASCLFGCQVIIVTLHPGGGVLLHLVAAVRIDIQRKTGGSVSQQVLYALYISPRGNRNGGGGVPEIMGPGVRPADTGSNPLERFIEGRYGKMPAHFIREYQIIRVAPQLTGGEAVFCLPLSLCPQILKRNFWRLDLPGLSVLCAWGDVVSSALLFLMLELLADPEPHSWVFTAVAYFHFAE